MRRRKPRTSTSWGFVLFGVALIAVGIAGFAWFTIRPLRASHDAADWLQTECTVVESRIEAGYDGEGDVVYDIHFRYELVASGQRFEGRRYDFVYETRNADRQVLAARYPAAGQRVACWYDPNDPRESVIHRRGWRGMTGLLPLAMLAFGAAAIARGTQRRVRRQTLPGGRCDVSMRNGRGMMAWIAGGVAFGIDAMLLAALVSAPWWQVVLWMIAGALATIWCVYVTCAYLTKVHVAIAATELAPGDRVDAKVTIRGPVNATAIDAKLVGRERSEWRDGSDAKIDLREFHKAELEGARIPRKAIPTLDRGKNTIDWVAHVEAELPYWPDVDLDVPLVVVGRPRTGEAPHDEIAAPPTDTPLALALDGGRDRFAPGDRIGATIAWKRERAPERAIVQLAWTSRSTHDVEHYEIVEEIDIATLPRLATPSGTESAPYRGAAPSVDVAGPLDATERRRLELVAPLAPYTFDGKFFAVWWTLELVVTSPDGKQDRESLTVTIASTNAESS